MGSNQQLFLQILGAVNFQNLTAILYAHDDKEILNWICWLQWTQQILYSGELVGVKDVGIPSDSLKDCEFVDGWYRQESPVGNYETQQPILHPRYICLLGIRVLTVSAESVARAYTLLFDAYAL